MSSSSNRGITWQFELEGYTFQWDISRDYAHLRRSQDNALIWKGSLLPLLWVAMPGGNPRAVKAVAAEDSDIVASDSFTLNIGLDDLGTGRLEVTRTNSGIEFKRLSIQWNQQPAPAIIGMYFGASLLSDDQRAIVSSLELPFWPDWTSDGYCIPSAKGGPIQSFFRCWDFGHATIPLGNFGPSLGTPYAAAFPRPLLAAAMGNDKGWMAVGPGAMPDAALCMQIKSATSMLQWLYREDLWGPGASIRQWDEPLRLAWAPTALDAYQRLFQTFTVAPRKVASHQRSSINSWGSFKVGDFNLRRMADRAADDIGAKVLVIDDLWETSVGSGVPSLERFADFEADLSYARSKGLELGFWQSVGWIDDVTNTGLTRDDLLCGVDGVPRKANWIMSPHVSGRLHYCLDISSSNARQFIRARTQRIMTRFQPTLLKLDFAYAMPGPDVAAPRDPSLRGERMGYGLIRLIAESAREINPAVTIQYYGIHPLMSFVTDIVALDDLGDAGAREAAGHAQWSIWATLLGSAGTAIMASSGYDWNCDEEMLLNTAVIGAPGCVLPLHSDVGSAMTRRRLLHRKAISRWHRRSTRWSPLWLDSRPGSLTVEPRLGCFGRLEMFDGAEQLTALALRSDRSHQASLGVLGINDWAGRWALISQDDRGIRDSREVACIALDEGFLELAVDHSNLQVLAVGEDGEHEAPNAEIHDNTIRIAASSPRLDEIFGYVIRAK